MSAQAQLGLTEHRVCAFLPCNLALRHLDVDNKLDLHNPKIFLQHYVNLA